MPAWLRILLGGLVLATACAWWLTRPLPLAADALPAHAADPANGERLLHAGGCVSCHAGGAAAVDGAPVLGGGLALDSPYGEFIAPNISPDPVAGIGGWSELDFINAMQRGLSPDGRHYYPAFPYTSYARMRLSDLLDLKAYLDTLPAVPARSAEHRLRFPYNLRRGLGLWKRMYLRAEPVRDIDATNPVLLRGRYLVEGPGHCGECHTPRNAMGALDSARWLSGAPSLEGEGRVPDITAEGLADWSESDIAYYLETGFEPDFDVVGGSMVKVQENMARLGEEDRAAIAAYLKWSGQP